MNDKLFELGNRIREAIDQALDGGLTKDAIMEEARYQIDEYDWDA